jgi:hypothetical protein
MALDTLVTSLDAADCIEVSSCWMISSFLHGADATRQVVAPLLVSVDGAPLLELLRVLNKIVSRVPADDLFRRLPNVLPGLFEARSPQCRRQACADCGGRRSRMSVRTCASLWCSAWLS